MVLNFLKANWFDPANDKRTEMVFADRNTKYGAYRIRRGYANRILLALLITSTVLLTAVLIPYLLTAFTGKSPASFFQSDEISLAEPPPIDKLTPPPPPVVLPPPVQKTIKFTPPVVVKDEIADEPPPTQEDMEEVQVSTVTQDGIQTDDLPEDNPVIAPPEEDKIFIVVEEMPSFPGGEKKMKEFILSNIRYPRVALENRITGKVYVKFMVDKDGKIRNPELLKGIGGGCDEEAIRILNIMPDWIPGKQNGNRVRVGSIVLHIDFTLR